MNFRGVTLAGNVGAGKTALAVQMALSSDFPFVKLCTPENMIGFTESAKCQSIKKVRALHRCSNGHRECFLTSFRTRVLLFS